MTESDIITLLLTPISKLTDEQIDFAINNRKRCDEVKQTKAYLNALLDSQHNKLRTPGGCGYQGVEDHVTHKSGSRKTVCTSAALAFFNVHPDSYHYSGHEAQDNAILRRHGWSVRSRKSVLGIKKGKTLGQVRKQLALGQSERGHYKVSIKLDGNNGYHCIVLDGQGQIAVDTAASMTNNRNKVRDIYLVTRK